MGNKILCVVRVSTDAQDTEQQRNDMLSFVISKGFREEDIVWITASGASARKANSKYLSMLEDIKATLISGDIKYCAFWHLNRLGRIEYYINLMKQWFFEHHVQVYVKEPSLTLLNDAGELDPGANIAWSVFASTISYDTIEMFEKMKRGKSHKKSLNGYIGGGLPYGFKVVDDIVVPDPDTMPIVGLIYYEFSTGNYSALKLSEELKSRGIEVSESRIYRILKNDVFSPYIDAEVITKCRELLNTHTWGSNSRDRVKVYLATRILRCPECGGSYVASNGKYFCYNHRYQKRANIDCHNTHNIATDVIDFCLWRVASVYHIEEMTSLSATTKTEAEQEMAVLQQKINKCHVVIDKSQEVIDRANELYVFGSITKERREQMLEKVKGDVNINTALIEQYESRMDTLQMVIKNTDSTDRWARIAYDIDNTKDREEMKKIVHKHIREAKMYKCTYNGRFAVRIEIYSNTGHLHRFLYFSYAKPKPTLYYLMDDDKIELV